MPETKSLKQARELYAEQVGIEIPNPMSEDGVSFIVNNYFEAYDFRVGCGHHTKEIKFLGVGKGFKLEEKTGKLYDGILVTYTAGGNDCTTICLKCLKEHLKE